MQQSYSPYSDYDMAHRTLGGFPNVPHIEIPNNILSPSGSSTPKPGPPPGATVSVTPTTRMKTYGVANVPQQTRHARRIYVGGIPPNYTDEDGLRDFFNAAISHGIGEDNDHSHVLSVYIDQKKCFAFIELKAIEIASACLELDGVIMKNIVLRILRANEYKPELVPPSMNKSIRFDLTGFQFGISNNAGSTTGEFNEGSTEKTLDSIIQYNNLNVLESGSVIIVGYPYDDLATRKCAATRGVGSAHAPKIMRNSIRKFKYGVVENSEYGQDLSKLKILDIGDVIGGKSPDETKTNLTTTVSELILRGGIPFIVGGSNELIYSSISGLMNVVGGNICTIDIASRMNTRLLEDSRFCQLRSTNAAFPSCEGRFVLFGAQGSQCSKDETKYIEARGGNVVWLNKDLRRNMSQKSVPEKFEELLKDLASLNPENPLPIAVTLDAGALCCMLAPMSNSNNGPLGLHFEEVAEMVRIAGADPNVTLLNVTEFSPQLDDTRTNLLLAELLYHFLLGVAARKTESGDARLLPFASFNSMDPKISSMSEAFARGPFNCATTMAEPILMANSENRVGTPSNISPQTSLVLRPPPYPVDHIDVFSSVHSNSPQCGSPASNSPRISHKSIPTPTNSELRQQLSQIAIQNNFKQNSGSNLTQNLAGIDMKKPSSFSVSSPSSRTMNMPPNVALRSASSLTSSSSSMSSVGSNDPRQFSRQPSFQNNFQPSSAGVGPSPRGLASSTANSLYTSASGSFNNNNRNGGLFVQNPHSANSNYSIMSNFEGVGEVHNFDESIDLANFDNHMNNQNYYGQQNFESSSGKEVNSFSSSNMSGYNNNSNSQSNGTMNGNSFHQSPLYSSNEFSSINSANSSNRQGDQSGSVYEY